MRSEMLVKPQARETLRCCTVISSVRRCIRMGTQLGRGKPRYAPSDCAEGARSISKHSRCVVNKTLDAKKHYAVDFHAGFVV